MLPNQPAEFEAVHFRHQNVREDRVRHGRLGFDYGISAVRSRRDAETEIGEIGGQKFKLRRIIVDDKNNPALSRHMLRSLTGRQVSAHCTDQKRRLYRFEQIIREGRRRQFFLISH